jgi:hypothetical protein
MIRELSNPRAHGSQAKLTPKQRRLIAEFEEISALIRINEDGRTAILQDNDGATYTRRH